MALEAAALRGHCSAGSERSAAIVNTSAQLTLALVFLLLNVSVVLAVLGLNRRAEGKPSTPRPQLTVKGGAELLEPADILGEEYQYASGTASEAMRDRHQMINFYLVFVGVVTSGVIAIVREESGSAQALGTVLLWLLCSVGWLYFLKIIRLRQAWYESVLAMNQIKEFYIQNAKGMSAEALRSAFRWRPTTLPASNKPWTLFFLSAMTIAFLDGVAFFLGGLLLNAANAAAAPWPVLGGLAAMTVALVAFYAWMYREFLRERVR